MRRVRSLVPSLALAAAAGLAAAFPESPATARQEYAKAEGRDCTHCHLEPKGGGLRNERGREYEANGHRFGVESWSSPERRDRYLRAHAALLATWYGEAARHFDVLAKEEKLPGGLALVEAGRERFRMFPRVWLRSAKSLLEKGERGLPNGLGFLAKLESQFPGTAEGKDAVALLDAMAKEEAKKEAVSAARAHERLRLVFLEGRTEHVLGNAARAKEVFERLLAAPGGKAFDGDVRAVLAGE